MNPFAEGALFVAATIVYGAATLLYFSFLIGKRSAESLGRVGPKLIFLAVTLHTAHICVASFYFHVCPVNGIHFPVSVVAVLMCVLFLALRARYRIEVLGAFVAPFAMTALAASRMAGGPGADSSARVKNVLLPLHVFVNVGGVALFGLAFASATLYLVQERLLKQKRVEGLFQRLPALDALDKAEHGFLLAGFPLLTVGILTGTVWARNEMLDATSDMLRAAFGYAAWLFIAGVLVLRAAAGWRGRRAAYGTIAGFGFAILVLLVYLFRTQSATAAIPSAHDSVVTATVVNGATGVTGVGGVGGALR